MSDTDANRYREIFALQEDGHWNDAAALIANLDDDLLLGHVQAQKYLHPDPVPLEVSRTPAMDAAIQRPPASKANLATGKQAPAAGLETPGQAFRLQAERKRCKHPAGTLRADTVSGQRDRAARREITRIERHIRRLIRKGAPTRAYRYLRSKRVDRRLDPDARAVLRAMIAHGYFMFGKDARAVELSEQSIDESDHAIRIAGWSGALAAWRLGDLDTAGRLFETLAGWIQAPAPLRVAAAYWAARVHREAGRTREETRYLIQASTLPGTLYGILANQALRRPHRYDWDLPTLTASQIKRLSEQPGARRALALIQIGQSARAEGELRRLYPSLPAALKPAVLTIAARHGMPALASRIAGIFRKERKQIYYAALFPVPDWEIRNDARVDPSLVYALMRKESNFNPRARNRSGAAGLMQIMPMTARGMDPHGVLRQGRGRSVLYDPEINIQLASKYIRHLLDSEDIGNDLFRTLAAYNAGPAKLKKWLKRVKHMDDPLLFMEAIPSPETRNFLEDVTRNLWIYRIRAGQSNPSLEQVAAGTWPEIETGYFGLFKGAAHVRD